MSEGILGELGEKVKYETKASLGFGEHYSIGVAEDAGQDFVVVHIHLCSLTGSCW